MNAPHAPALPQVAVQSTPRVFASDATVAVRVAGDPGAREAGGPEDIVTTIGVAVTIFAMACAESTGLVVDLAVIVTVPLGGAFDGAEYVVATPLAVWRGVRLPQLSAPQLTDQSTPAAAGSLSTTAVSGVECVAPVSCAYTVPGFTVRLTAGGSVTVIDALADLAVSVAEVAVKVTVPPAGTADGAV